MYQSVQPPSDASIRNTLFIFQRVLNGNGKVAHYSDLMWLWLLFCFCSFLSCSAEEAAVEWQRFQQAGLLWRPLITTEVSLHFKKQHQLHGASSSLEMHKITFPQQSRCFQWRCGCSYARTPPEFCVEGPALNSASQTRPLRTGLGLTLEPVLLSQCSVVCKHRAHWLYIQQQLMWQFGVQRRGDPTPPR